MKYTYIALALIAVLIVGYLFNQRLREGFQATPATPTPPTAPTTPGNPKSPATCAVLALVLENAQKRDATLRESVSSQEILQKSQDAIATIKTEMQNQSC
jgi:hypothetical protein